MPLLDGAVPEEGMTGDTELVTPVESGAGELLGPVERGTMTPDVDVRVTETTELLTETDAEEEVGGGRITTGLLELTAGSVEVSVITSVDGTTTVEIPEE